MSNLAARGIGKREWLSLAGFVVVCYAIAAFGAIFSPDEWYRNLEKPAFQPPNWLFAPVWTVLYGLIAVAGWLVWRKSPHVRTAPALNVYGLQLILNGAWSWLFFGQHRPGLALIDILLLWIAIVVTIVLFWRVSRPAGLLLVPYLAWVSFAAVLNFAIWRLNA